MVTQLKGIRTNPSAIVLEVLAWTLVAFVAASWMRISRPTPLFNDSYQYLNVADNIRHGRGISTSLIHFDTERSHGRIPAPLTTFPPGYPVAIAMAGFRGDVENAARIVSNLCFTGTAALLAWSLIAAGVARFFRPWILLLFITNAATLSFATSILTEPLYTFLSTAAVVTLLWAENATPPRQMIARSVVGLIAAGLAYWVRYAGLFLILGVICYALLQLLRERSRLRLTILSLTLIPLSLAAILMVRNAVLVGTWRGGNDLPVENPLRKVAPDYIRAQVHLLWGGHAATLGVWEALLLTGGLALVVLSGIVIARGRSHPQPAALLVSICAAVYSAGIFYAGLRTAISFGPRMFVPVLPLYLLLLGMGLNWVAQSSRGTAPGLKMALALFVIGYAGVNARDLYDPRRPAPHEVLSAMYSQPSTDGQSLTNWLASNIRADQTITATDGQATGYLLRRPTLSLIASHYSPERWECEEVSRQMQRFHSQYLIVYKPPSQAALNAKDDSFLVDESQLVAAAVSGHPPCGFSMVAWNAGVRILKAP